VTVICHSSIIDSKPDVCGLSNRAKKCETDIYGTAWYGALQCTGGDETNNNNNNPIRSTQKGSNEH